MQFDWAELVRQVFSRESAFIVSILVLVLGIVVAYWVWRGVRGLLRGADVDDSVEGTPFERTAQSLGTSTVNILAVLTGLFVYVAAVIIALNIAQLLDGRLFWSRLTGYLPRLFIAAIAIVLGLVAGDKAALLVSDRLRSIKLPEAELIPEIVKYSIFYIAALLALAQIGVATSALLILLAAYAFGLVFLSGLAFKDLLAASAAGIYLLLVEPYAIGDEVEIDEKRGIVQEVDMFVTHIEADGEEYVIPNQRVLKSPIVRIRD
ncbi:MULTISPECIES: mechanosensitive ion channel domain-containing protein [Salinibaculum]|uniref:mechanosensitive ion channel domain-containing protein n=1 Tax=Salinibaculum TaxID=2732368 RepID=UPI0030D2F57F